MQLTFLGTRANLGIDSPSHRRHSALLVQTPGLRLMIDCGRDWADDWQALQPDSILLTHGHDDHAGGLTSPLPVPVHAVASTWNSLPQFVTDRHAHRCREQQLLHFSDLQATAIPLQHSLRAPAVGWLLERSGKRVFYAPDVAMLPDPAALPQLDLYIGDGSSFDDSLLRIENGRPCGHSSIPSQLQWCHRAGVDSAFFTHCGTEILTGEREAKWRLASQASGYDVTARFADDGLEITIDPAG